MKLIITILHHWPLSQSAGRTQNTEQRPEISDVNELKQLHNNTDTLTTDIFLLRSVYNSHEATVKF